MEINLTLSLNQDTEGYFVGSVPALPGCHTQAKSLDVLMERIREAIALCLEVEGQPAEKLRFCRGSASSLSR